MEGQLRRPAELMPLMAAEMDLSKDDLNQRYEVYLMELYYELVAYGVHLNNSHR